MRIMYQFTEDCLIGIPEIDREHEKLFRLINEVFELLHNEKIYGRTFCERGVLYGVHSGSGAGDAEERAQSVL